MSSFTVLEVCAGAGGQSLGLERAGFQHTAAIDIDHDACMTLRANRPAWDVLEGDIYVVDGRHYQGVDLLAGGVPCPPFSIAGKQLGDLDERDLFPQVLRIAEQMNPKAIMIENVRGLSSKRFSAYRAELLAELDRLGYEASWRLLNASMFGVPQLRPRFILVALKAPYAANFHWPLPARLPPSVGETVRDLMASNGWRGASAWAKRANRVAPTIVGGSKKHGGPDLGPSRARADWLSMSVDGRGLADAPPDGDFPTDGTPKLTLRMVARLQGFPDEWQFTGRKTAAYRQIGNAFPPPFAEAIGTAIRAALSGLEVPVAGQLKLAPPAIPVS